MPIWTITVIIVGIMWFVLGLSQEMYRRRLQRRRTIGMLNAMYGTQTGQRAMMENMQMNLSTVSARQWNTADGLREVTKQRVFVTNGNAYPGP
jgi:hypothetical protein